MKRPQACIRCAYYITRAFLLPTGSIKKNISLPKKIINNKKNALLAGHRDGVPCYPVGRVIREKSHYTILPLESRNQESASKKNPITPFYHWNPETRNLHLKKSHYTILPLESRNQESASMQIPGFWIPMVKWCNGIFL